MRFLLSALIFFSAISTYSQSKKYSFVFLHKRTSAEQLPKDQLEKLMQGHLANIERLAKEGKLIVAGPFEGGGGIFILNTTSTEEATQWLSTDPGVQANRWDVEILPYTPRVGSVCAVKEPYEMVTYHFIRFKESKNSTDQNAIQILKQHQEKVADLIGKGNVITEGIFDLQGKILILKEDTAMDIFESDPAVQHGLISVDSKKLWIAKGSFCER